jgi:hypothetical protein
MSAQGEKAAIPVKIGCFRPNKQAKSGVCSYQLINRKISYLIESMGVRSNIDAKTASEG